MKAEKIIKDKQLEKVSLVVKPANLARPYPDNQDFDQTDFRDFLLLRNNVFILILLLVLISTVLIIRPALAQENQEKYLVEKLLVYVDPSIGASEILEKNIPFAKFVSDPAEANVIVEISRTVKEGQEYFQIKFTGKNELSGKDYFSELTLPPNTEPDLVQNELARMIKLGLVLYAGRTPEASRLKIRL